MMTRRGLRLTTDRKRRRIGTMLVAVALTAGGTAIALTAGAQADPNTPKPTGNQISVDFVPNYSTAPCILAPQMEAYPDSTGTAFTLMINAPADLCSPVYATAAVYATDSLVEWWPQHLIETKPVVINKGGQYHVRFAKVCRRQQFDVINGATPDTIGSFRDHGPLVFPLDSNTSLQDIGNQCSDTKPSPAVVRNVTTTAPDAGVSNTGGQDVNDGNVLASTGAFSATFAVVALALMAAGFVLLFGSGGGLDPAVRMVSSRSSVDPHSPFGLGD